MQIDLPGIMITDPSDRVAGTLGGSAHDIPVLRIGDPHGAGLDIRLHPTMLTTEQQVAWLRGFAAVADALAERITQAAEWDRAIA